MPYIIESQTSNQSIEILKSQQLPRKVLSENTIDKHNSDPYILEEHSFHDSESENVPITSRNLNSARKFVNMISPTNRRKQLSDDRLNSSIEHLQTDPLTRANIV